MDDILDWYFLHLYSEKITIIPQTKFGHTGSLLQLLYELFGVSQAFRIDLLA